MMTAEKRRRTWAAMNRQEGLCAVCGKRLLVRVRLLPDGRLVHVGCASEGES